MDDMRLLQRIGEEVPPATPEQLAPARARLLAAMAPPAPAPTPARRTTRRSWRLVFGGLVAAGVAVAVTSVVVLAPDGLGGDVPAAKADARQVLRNAAAASLRTPDIVPRSDQFIYRRTQYGQAFHEVWQSVDGTRDGLVRQTAPAGGTETTVLPGCRNGRAALIKGDKALPGRTEPCTPQPAYRTDVPTDAAAMRAYLAEQHSGGSGSVNAVGKEVHILAGSYLRPQSRAALYEAAAAMPGLRAVENVSDGAGRPGIGITWDVPNGGGLNVLVFDAGTHAFLGTQGTSAMVSLTVVDKVGQTG
ncbi:hypothetical protein GA0070606_2581 [Micromonospora citrea]|uniref:Uncharacterized protein n=1 Tax=Micromonospora citrea TaxID=47855 RepID=A0A1C6UQF4_9ACTN|nr:CU044_5270 family protein [Micromonospora citrea]SCL56285.1 hypothetical protein GA0070606_2581 [Micromonospora citrea]